jgi:glutamate--cysteine ligase
MRDGFQGHRATLDDWTLHLSTLFPEARLKQFIEVRGCDAGSIPMILALGPLCHALLYDDVAMREATALTAALDMSDRLDLATAVARTGLSTEIPAVGRTVLELARELIDIAEDGLRRVGPVELPFLEPLREIVDTGRSPADHVIGLWEREPDTVERIRRLAYPGLGGE